MYGTQDRKPNKRPDDYWQAGYDPMEERELFMSGLRGRKLCIVLCVLCALLVLALVTLMCNIMLLSFLRLSHRGMDALQFHRLPNKDKNSEEHVVEFTGKHVELDEAITNNGSIGGYKNDDFHIQGQRVLLSTTNGASNDKVKLELVLEDGRIRLEGVTDFLAVSQHSNNSGQTMFSALHPKFRLDKSIKTFSTRQIMTNQIISPVDQPLKFEVKDLSFRGNEFNSFKGRSIHFLAENNIDMRTSDSGQVRLKADAIYWNDFSKYQLSSSPSLSADLLAKRLCACINTHRLFTVPGNKPCNIDPGYCY